MLDLSDTDLSEMLAPLRIGGNGMVGINVAKRIQPELLGVGQTGLTKRRFMKTEIM